MLGTLKAVEEIAKQWVNVFRIKIGGGTTGTDADKAQYRKVLAEYEMGGC